MRAVLSKTPGGPETLVVEDVLDPTPKAGEVIIEVKAVGINYPDTLIIEDRYQFRPPRPFSPGGEVSGVIDAVGEGVTTLTVGTRVIGWAGWGGMAEKLVLGADRCLPIPDAMPFETAAAFLMTYGTSMHALKDRGRVKAGDTLLVLGAAGGVGLAGFDRRKGGAMDDGVRELFEHEGFERGLGAEIEGAGLRYARYHGRAGAA